MVHQKQSFPSCQSIHEQLKKNGGGGGIVPHVTVQEESASEEYAVDAAVRAALQKETYPTK